MITLLTFGLGLGNYGMISIFMGEFALTVIVFLLRLVSQKVPGNTETKTIFSLFPTEAAPQFPSIWLSTMSFFFGALILNAYQVYKIDPMDTVGSDPNIIAQIDTPIFQSKVNNRKTRCIMIMITCTILALVLIGYRALFVEARTSTGDLGVTKLFMAIIAILMGGGAAALWYKITLDAPNFGLRNMDIFGISQQLVAVTQTDMKTMCELKPA
jgi:hypothetical protein